MGLLLHAKKNLSHVIYSGLMVASCMADFSNGLTNSISSSVSAALETVVDRVLLTSELFIIADVASVFEGIHTCFVHLEK